MHEVHFLTLAVVQGRQGWVAPVELFGEGGQGAVYVIPVGSRGETFRQYRLDL